MIASLPHLISILALIAILGCNQNTPVVAQEISAATGHLRYEAETGLLMLEIVLADSATSAPLFRHEAMEVVSGTAGQKYIYEATDTVSDNKTTIIIEADGAVSFEVPFEPITIDSLADTLDLQQVIVMAITDHPITDSERITIVFEPEGGGMPRRMVVHGPTTSGTITLSAPAESEVSEGSYNVYLVRQQLIKSRQKNIRLSLQTDYFTPRRRITVR